MKRMALTFIGRDRAGIIAEVSRILFETGCNIEDTTMTILEREREFAMILIAKVPGRAAELALKKSFKVLKSGWGLDCFSKTVSRNDVLREEKHPTGTTTYVVSVAGRDRTGIVHQTSQILAKHALNITDLNSKILGQKGKSVFMMILEVDVPKSFSMKRLEPEWRKLRSQLGVDVSVRPLERLSL